MNKYVLPLCAGLLLLGMADLPGGYYLLVRVVVTVGAVWLVVKEPVKDVNLWRVVFGVIAILFNPIIPIYLHDKGVWQVIDLVAAVLFLIKWYKLKPKKRG